MLMACSSKRWGYLLLIALSAACGGSAFHIDHDDVQGGSAGTGGSTATAGRGGSTSTGGRPLGGNAGTPSGGTGAAGGVVTEAGAPPVGGEGGGPEPEPSPISKEGLVYWFKADAGVTQAAGRVSRWADQSGNALDAVQNLDTQQPLLTQLEPLPYPVVALDGGDALQLPPLDAPIDGGLTFFAVAGRSADTGCAAIVEMSNGKEIDDVHFGLSGLSMHYEVQDVWHDSGEVFEVGATRQVTFKQSGDAMTAKVDMSANGSFVASHEIPFPKRISREMNFIGRSEYCSGFVGGIGEIVLYSRVLGREEQTAVEQYLLTKWQLGK